MMKTHYISTIAGHSCGGHRTSTSDGEEYECEYEPDFSCDECVFVVAQETGDKRKGKRPWAEENQI